MKNGMFDKTIAAIATPLGLSGIGIVRVSGPASQAIAETIFRPFKSSHPLPSHRLCYGHVIDPSNGHMIDEALAALMRAPYTYTREDCLEIQAHGGITVLQEILYVVLNHGSRLARPGEFTLRAFLNGRIDLPQAEAVADIINARSHTSLELARRQLSGGVSKALQQIKEDLLEVLSLLEAAIDFPEEDIPLANSDDLQRSLERIENAITDWVGSFAKGKLCKEGASIMIIGAPNAGKSSLLNAMVGFERAIVTEIPGTTRDMVDEWIEWKGMPIRAIDTAGLRDPKDPIEAEGHRLLLARIRGVDLIIWVIDSNQPLISVESDGEELIQDIPCIVALNKIDLPSRCGKQDLPSFMRAYPVVEVSALEGTGIERLLDAARERLIGSIAGEDLLLTNIRHKLLLESTLSHVRRAKEELARSDYVELAAAELYDARNGIQEILGERIDDEILTRIFERFCIGK